MAGIFGFSNGKFNRKPRCEYYREYIGEWHLQKDKFNTILTDDWDSLLSACLLKHLLGWSINYFHSFTKLYVLNESDTRESVGVDLSRTKGKTFDNHLQMFNRFSDVNPESVNLNHFMKIGVDRIGEKFPFSTFMLLLWVYKDRYQLNWDDEGLIKFILTVDSSYKSYYEYNENCVKWLYYMGLEKFLDVLKKYEKEDFDKLKSKCAENGTKLIVNDKGQLTFGNWNDKLLQDLSQRLGFEVSLPQGQFKAIKHYKNVPFNEPSLVDDFMRSNRVYCYVIKNSNGGKVSYEVS